jgi:hypothetical protein
MEFAYNEQMSVPRAPIQLFAPVIGFSSGSSVSFSHARAVRFIAL